MGDYVALRFNRETWTEHIKEIVKKNETFMSYIQPLMDSGQVGGFSRPLLEWLKNIRDHHCVQH